MKILHEMVDLQVIAKVTETTEWLSSLTYPHKPDSPFCICLDPHDLNKFIIWEHHKVPTLDEITHKLSETTVFSKLDKRDGFRDIHLDTTSLYLSTFNTHRGCYHFLYMPFGLNMSQIVFQIHTDKPPRASLE